MNADAFRQALAALGMSQRGAAREWEVNERTVRSWAAGRYPIPKWAERELSARLEKDADNGR